MNVFAKNATPKDRTVDLLQTIFRTWFAPRMPPGQFDEIMKAAEWMRSQPNDIQVATRFETDPISKRMTLQCIFAFPDNPGPASGLILPNKH